MSDDLTRIVVRPSIPPLVWFSVGVWTGAYCAEGVTWSRGPDLRGAWAYPVLVALAVFAVFASLRGRVPVLLLGLSGVLLGSVSGTAFWYRAGCRVDPGGQSTALRLVITSDPETGAFGPVSEAYVVPSRGSPYLVRVEWGSIGEAPELGRSVVLNGTAKRFESDEWGRRAHRAGIAGSVDVSAVERSVWTSGYRGVAGRMRAWSRGVLDRIPGTGADLLTAVVLADCRRLEDGVVPSDFRTAGLSHLIAVSGGHLVIVAGFTEWALGVLRVRRRARWPLTGALTAFYVIFTGVQPSAVRSWVMSLVPGFTRAGRRRNDGLASLAFAVVAVIVWSPSMVFDIGFRLSVASVFALIVFARLATAWLRSATPRIAWPLAEPLSLTLVAQAGTLPIACAEFGTFSLIAPIANLAVGPAIGIGLLGGITGLCVIPAAPGVGGLMLRASSAACGYSAAAASGFASVPHASIPLGSSAGLIAFLSGLSCLLAWILWPRPSRVIARTALTLVVMSFVAPALAPDAISGPEMVVLDVGQGDAILVRSGGRCVLVDTGPSESMLLSALAAEGVRHVDEVVLTHPHADHSGGAESVGSVMGADVLSVPGVCVDDPSVIRLARSMHVRLRPLSRGDRIVVGGVRLDVVWPADDVGADDGNSACLVLLATYCGRAVLLTGDAEDDVLARLAREGTVGDIDVLKVGHHGSRISVSEASLQALRPEVALISVGRGNRYGHPVAGVLRLLAHHCARTFRTDQRGSLTYDFANGTVTCAVGARGP